MSSKYQGGLIDGVPSFNKANRDYVEARNQPSLYADLMAAGIVIDNHESDLYFPKTPATEAILARHPDKKAIATIFHHSGNGATWFDVPFAYLPYWEAKGRYPK
jgi:hypothetical protein